MTTSRDNIILIGMPGAGKSTVGVLLAKRLGFAFIDTDILIQTGEKRKLRQIIASAGLERFLQIEEKYLLAFSGTHNVIATGGSAVYSSVAMGHLGRLGEIVHLHLDFTSLESRLGDLASRGVVHNPGQTLAALYRERYPLYMAYANTTITCTAMNPEEIVEKIVETVTR